MWKAERAIVSCTSEGRRLKAVEKDWLKVVSGKSTIDEVAIGNGLFEVRATSQAWQFLCRQVMAYFEALGAENYLEQSCTMRLLTRDVDWVITVQRAQGKSPGEVAADWKAKAIKAKQRAFDQAVDIVESEEELDGPIPEELYAKIIATENPDEMAFFLRAAVQSTKKSIVKRLREEFEKSDADSK